MSRIPLTPEHVTRDIAVTMSASWGPHLQMWTWRVKKCGNFADVAVNRYPLTLTETTSSGITRCTRCTTSCATPTSTTRPTPATPSARTSSSSGSRTGTTCTTTSRGRPGPTARKGQPDPGGQGELCQSLESLYLTLQSLIANTG